MVGLLALLILFANRAPHLSDGLASLFPQTEEIEGWVRDGENFIADDEATLYEWINGAAPYYFEFGAVEVGFQDYVQEDVFLSLEIYRMEDPEHADALYADIFAEYPEAIPLGDAARLVSNLPGVLLFEMHQSAFFVRVTADDKSPATREAILAFAEWVSQAISEQHHE